jgi:hypothetical protein
MATGLFAQTPVINEFMASNTATIQDDDGDFSDWIELHNPGNTAFDLTGCYLSDDTDNPLRWRFPGGNVPAQGFLLVWASGKDRMSPGGELHTNFAISASGEPLLFTAPDGVTRLDETGPFALAADVSYGRLPDGADYWVEFAEATPAAPNDQGLQALAAPEFSQAPGIFAEPVTLTLSAVDPEAVITYTLDGSEPTLASTVYDEPLILADRVGDPNIYSLIPTNAWLPWEIYRWRPPRGEVYKINVVRARAFRPGHAPSRITTGSFIVDPTPAANLPFPVVSVAAEPDDLFDNAIGIYVPGVHYVPGDIWSGNYFQTGSEWERLVHLELFDATGNLLLSQDAGARIHGGLTRAFPQKTLRFHARAEYGAPHFECALFPELPYDVYERFLLRNSGNDWGKLGFLDLLWHTICADMGFDTQAGRPTIHFINGEYWGIANLRERFDRHYLARVYSVPEDEVALLNNDAVIDEGADADRLDYLALRDYVLANDMSQPAALAYVAERMDLENYIAYNVAEIFSSNADWPGNNIRYWRRTLPAYNPDAPYGHDGRWRWMMYDVDFAFQSSYHNTLSVATAANGPAWPNPPWSTQLLRRLLGNEWFRRAFINAFADHLNSTFKSARIIGMIDEFAACYQPAIAAWQDRWDVNVNYANEVQLLRNYANQRPNYQRQHITSYFSLAGTTAVNLDVNDPALGKLQINQLVIDENLHGLANPAQPYPWSGIYFRGVPITVTALPEPGYRFAAWIGHTSPEPALTIDPGSASINLIAVFEADPAAPVPLHAWHFNDLPDGTVTAVAADFSLFGTAMLTYPGTGAGYMDRVDDGTLLGALPTVPAGYALRVRNPADTRELLITVPSIGHDNLSLSYAVKRTANGAEEHSVYCRVAVDGPWQSVAESVAVTEEYQLWVYDLAAIAGTADNPDLQVRLTFGGQNASGTSGNQRFDNLVLVGVPIPGANLPPKVTEPIALQQGIEGGQALALDLSLVFTDPDGDPLVFAAESDDPDVTAVAVAGSELTITTLMRGDARVTVTADDGNHAPVPHTFRVLVYPAAAALAESAYAFTEWDPDLPERTYPEHMLFLQSDVSDPGLAQPLLYPYFIPHDDYHADDQETIGFPYNNTGRTRINGLGEEGISFINTGRGRDLGAALLAVDTRDVNAVSVSWLAGTILPNSRIYAIRLQCRVGIDGEFSDVLVGGQPVEYLRSEIAGDVQALGPTILPAELLQRPYLQLLWRYYHVEGTSGARAQLRLDDVQVIGAGSTAVAEPALPTATTLHGTAPNPFNPAMEIQFSVRQGETARLDIYNGRGQRVRSLGQFAVGHHRQVWNGTDDQGQRCASGVYFCRLQAPSGSQTRKVLMVK